jgi:phage-related protein
MDDVEYILRIVLKARDDMALVLAKARRELRGFTADADKMNTSVASLNKAMGEFNNNMDGVTKKLEGWRAILRDAADDSKKSAKSLDSLTKAAEKNARVSKQSVETQKQLQDRARALRGEVDKITKARTAESISADLAVTKYRALAKALEEVSLKMSKAARERTPAHRWAADASEAADEIKQTDKDITNDALVERKRRDAELAKTEAIRLANVKRHNKQVEDEILASIDRLEGDQKEAERLRLANVKSHNKGVENEILDSIKRLEENQKEAEYIRLANVKRHNKQVEDEILGAITKLEGDQKEVERLRLTNVKRHNKEVEDEILASIISLEQSQKEVERLRLANVKRHNKEVEDEISASIDKLEEDQKEAERLRLANVKRHNKQVEDEILRQIERQEKAEALRVAIVKLSNAQISREIEQQIKDEEQASKQRIKLAEKEAALQERITRVNQRASAVRGRVASGSHDRGDVGELRRIAAEQNSIANAFAVGSDEARHFNAEAEHSRDVLRSITRESERTSASTKKLSERFHGAGASVAGFDNQLRGLGILAAVVSIQQLISAAIALGGELVSLAGSAVMAGGALGGVLAAGAAQALPVIGLLAGAFQRVKSVIDAVQQSQKLQQAQFTDAEKGSQKAADQTYKLANANDAVAAANDNLAESRKNLTQAQKEGVDQLQDLILAERQAGLAARGAALDVKSAQEALRLAIAGGASQLEIDQKRLAVDEARNGQSRAGVTLQRATRDRQAAGGDVNKLDSVKQAAKSVDDAEKAVKRANRGLDQAEEKTARVASTTMTAAANLDFLLSQLSPAERRLYDAATSLYESYKKIFQGTGTGGSGIYGVIIDAFARAVTKVESIMEMPKVIAGIQGLANVIGQNIDKIVGAIDPKTIDQLLTIIGDAGDNMGPLVDLAIKLAKAFLNIAETANPAFQNLIKYIGPIVDKFLGLTADKDKMEDFFKSGEKHLESWLDLIGAVIGLFVALTGASADSGKTSIEDLTKKIQGYTDWIDSHHDQVVGFFEDAREAAYAIGGVLENLAVTLAKSFSSDRVKQFADILNKVVIPALAGVIETLGRVVDEVSNLIDSPLGVKVAKWAVGLFLLAKVASSITGVFGMFWKLIGNVVGAGEKLVDTFKFLGGAASKFLGVMTRLATALQVAGAMTSGLSGKAGILGKVLEGLGRMIPFIFGPWGIVIAAVIIGVGLLLKHFGKLDDVWNAIKKATKGFMKDIEPAIKALQDALEGLGIKVSSIHDVLKFLERAGKVLADFIATYLIGYIEGFFKILAGVVTFVVRVIAGLIEILHGLADILIGIFTLDGDQIKKGFKGLVDGIVDIFWGIVDGLKLVFEGILKIMLAPFKAAWNAIKEFFGVASPSKLAKKLGEAIIDGIVAGIKGAAHALSQLADWIWGKIRNGLKSLGRSIKGAANWLIDKFVDYIRAEVKGLKAIGEWIWNAIRASIRAYASLYKTIVSWLWDKFTDYLKLEIKSFKKIGEWIYNAMSDGIHTIGDKLESLGKRLIDAVIRGIKKAPKAISDAIDWLLDKVPGGGAVKKGLQALGAVEQRLPGFAQGGPVPGTGSGDTVPARLTPGEHVLTKQEVAAAGGHGTIFAIRRLLGGGGQALGSGFQTGGAVYDPRTGLMHGGVTPPTLPVADDAKQREAYKHSTTERANNWRIMWNDMLTTARRSANDIEKQFRDMRVNTANSTDRMYREVRGSIADIQNSFNVRGKIIVDNWADNWLSLMKVTAEGLFYIGHETNKALTSLGEKYISFGFTAPKKSTEGKAIGGWIGKQGERGKDAGMFALGRGEAVLNWGHQAYVEPAMNAYYGHGLGTMFDRVRGYHAGGPGQAGFAAGKPNFYGRPTNVTQGIKDLIALMQQHFPLLQVTSTTNHGKYTTTGNISDHGSGHAVDLASGDYGYMTKAAAWILSSGLYKRLKQGIHNPNLAVNAGQRQDPPGQFAGRTWGEHAKPHPPRASRCAGQVCRGRSCRADR